MSTVLPPQPQPRKAAMAWPALIAPLIEGFENLDPQRLAELQQLYTEDARFEDPFNAVQGLPAIRAVFQHMYDSLLQPHFIVVDALLQGSRCVLVWDFRFRLRGAAAQDWQCVRGCSWLELAGDGRICVHRDYWDAAAGIYEKLPVLGGVLRWLRRRMGPRH